MNVYGFKRRRLCAPGDEFDFEARPVLQQPACLPAVTVLAAAAGGHTPNAIREVQDEAQFSGFLSISRLDTEDEQFESGSDEPLSASESTESSNPPTPSCRPRRARNTHRVYPELPTRRSSRIAAADSSSLGSGYGPDGLRFSLRIRSRQATSLL